MMNPRSDNTTSVEDILQGHAPEVRQVVETLRQLVKETAPQARESAHASWHSIHYHDPQNGYFCGIFPLKDSTSVVFEFGILLPDPENILQGTGKQVRNIILHSVKEIPSAALRDVILAALALPGSRKDKLRMIQSGARPASGKL